MLIFRSHKNVITGFMFIFHFQEDFSEPFESIDFVRLFVGSFVIHVLCKILSLFFIVVIFQLLHSSVFYFSNFKF